MASPYLVQGLLAELLVSDNPSGLALEKLCLSSLLDGMLAQPHLQVGHVIPAHVRDAVGCGEDVLPGDQAASTELAAVVHQRRNPGPLTLVGVPTVHDLGAGLVGALHLLGNLSVAVVPDRVVTADTTLAGRRTGRPVGHWGLGGCFSNNRCNRWTGGDRLDRLDRLRSLDRLSRLRWVGGHWRRPLWLLWLLWCLRPTRLSTWETSSLSREPTRCTWKTSWSTWETSWSTTRILAWPLVVCLAEGQPWGRKYKIW